MEDDGGNATVAPAEWQCGICHDLLYRPVVRVHDVAMLRVCVRVCVCSMFSFVWCGLRVLTHTLHTYSCIRSPRADIHSAPPASKWPLTRPRSPVLCASVVLCRGFVAVEGLMVS